VKTVALVPQPGDGLVDFRHRTAADTYLQDRLLIFYGVGAVAIVVFLVIMEAVDLAVGEWSVQESVLDPSQLVHIVVTLGMAGLYLLLRRHTFSHLGLRVLDAVGFLCVVLSTLVVYSESYYHGLSPLILTVLSTFVIAHAIVVPSTALHTLLLSLSAPAVLLGIHLHRGVQPFVLSDPHGPAFVVWHQAVLLFSVAIATLAARVTFNLRNRVAEAQRMGEYRIDALIGKGGMGTVYRATHAMLRRPTAIKVLDPEIAAPRTLARFELEVQRTSRLSHPNNIQVYDYGTTADGLFYYAMEYLDGADLTRILDAGGPLPPGRVIHVLRQACAALAEAHELGLVHRDVKPANIILCWRGGKPDVVKVLDYGIARDLGAHDPGKTPRFGIAGTPEYMPPEVIHGHGADPQSDVYSLGATAYQLVTGNPVFDATTPGEHLAQHVGAEPLPPRERLDTVPADLEAVILRCLAKRPEDRFPGMRALCDAVEACADARAWTTEDAEAWWRAYGWSDHGKTRLTTPAAAAPG